MADLKQPTTDEHLSRQEYREQLARQKQQVKIGNTDTVPDAVTAGRQQYADQEKSATAAEKTAVLKHKLNIAIIGLLVAIVIVYLILFYVG